MSDELNPNEQKLAAGLANARFLIADTASSRQSVRKLLTHFRVKPHLIDVVENYGDAKDFLAKNKAPYLFVEVAILETANGPSLIQMHHELLADVPGRAIFLIGGNESKASISGYAEEGVDAVLLKPFTFDGLRSQVVEVLLKKLNPTPFEMQVHEAKSLLIKGDIDAAIAKAREARKLDPKPVGACAIEGQGHLAKKQHQPALECFQEGLAFDAKHYGCLIGSVESYIALGNTAHAYQTARELASHHTVPLQRLPTFIRLSVENQEMKDVLALSEVSEGIENLPLSIGKYLAAGLVVCGAWLSRRGQSEPAMKAYKKAEALAKGNAMVLKRLACHLFGAGQESEAQALLKRAPNEVRDDAEVITAEALALEKSGKGEQALAIAMQLQKKGARIPEVYEILIRQSIAAKRSEEAVIDLIAQAAVAFPALRERFESLLKTP